MNRLDRLRERWNSPAMLRTRRLVRLFLWAIWRVAAMVLRELRLVSRRLSPRARIFALIVGLVLISVWTGTAMPLVSAVANALGVLLLACVGLWIIVTAPFRSRGWW
jgi:hypothetical protein